MKLESNIDLIIPVLLHFANERKRGYNQSHYFANGISEISQIPVNFTYLSRIKHVVSLTGKTREL